MSTSISQDDYLNAFKQGHPLGAELRQQALQHALDTRKFEIELYWRRATYFWTFIGATLIGYGAIRTADEPTKTDFSVMLGCLGVVFSVAWYCANRGSKQWQENWEHHVDLLEDEVIGPLYKTIVRRKSPSTAWAWLELQIVGPARYSVTKINQILSLFVTILFVILLFHALPPFTWRGEDFSPLYFSQIALSVAATAAILGLARTSSARQSVDATRRETRIE